MLKMKRKQKKRKKENEKSKQKAVSSQYVYLSELEQIQNINNQLLLCSLLMEEHKI